MTTKASIAAQRRSVSDPSRLSVRQQKIWRDQLASSREGGTHIGSPAIDTEATDVLSQAFLAKKLSKKAVQGFRMNREAPLHELQGAVAGSRKSKKVRAIPPFPKGSSSAARDGIEQVGKGGKAQED